MKIIEKDKNIIAIIIAIENYQFAGKSGIPS